MNIFFRLLPENFCPLLENFGPLITFCLIRCRIAQTGVHFATFNFKAALARHAVTTPVLAAMFLYIATFQ